MPANITGFWNPLSRWPIVGIHSMVTQDGKVLTFGSDQFGTQGAMYHDVWDPVTGEHHLLDHHLDTPTDIFCAASIIIPGTSHVLIAGGDARPLGSVNTGVSDVNLYDVNTQHMHQIEPMAYARWYSTAISLSDGRILVIGGTDFNGNAVAVPEVYTPGEGWRTLTGAADSVVPQYYPRSFVNADGKVVYFGTVGGNDTGVMLLDPTGDGSLTRIGTLPFGYNWESPAIQYAPGVLLINDGQSGLWTMDFNGDTPVFNFVGDLGLERNFSNMTVLADRSVLINGGSTITNVDATAVKTALIWNPVTNTLTPVGDEAVPRLYHSSSVLLPDGTVLSLGGGSLAAANGTLATQLNGQIYKPGYLFDANGNEAVRPEILAAPEHMQGGTTFTITVSDAADIARITFVKNGSATHDFNMGTTALDLEFTYGPNNTLNVILPDYREGVAAGSWMLFVWNKAGVPSVAPVVEVDPVFATGGGIDVENLLVNGSFETAADLDMHGGHHGSLHEVVGWTASGHAVDLVMNGHHGNHVTDGRTAIEVDAPLGTISQAVKTQAGASYEVTFDYAASHGNVASSSMVVLWAGRVLATINPDGTHQHFHFNVTGTGGMDELAFRAVVTDTDGIGGLLDNVVVQSSNAGADRLFGWAGHDDFRGRAGADFLLGDGVMMPTDTAMAINRVYLTMLDRAPDTIGWSTWTTQLDQGRPLIDIVSGFVNSPEFQGRYGALSNAQFVTRLYENALDRAPDAAGLAHWVGLLNAGTTRESVVLGFSESDELKLTSDAENHAGQIYRLYGAALDREPEAGGFLGWVSELGDGMGIKQATEGFLYSPEFQANYGALNNTQFVTLLYNNVLDRAPDAAGLQGWLAELANGASRAGVVLGFSESAEYRQKTNTQFVEFMRNVQPDAADSIDGGSGNDVLSGGLGSDTFVFRPNNGVDDVWGYEAWDTLRLLDFGYDDRADALGHMLQSGGNVVFNDQGTTFTLHGATIDELRAADWLFV